MSRERNRAAPYQRCAPSVAALEAGRHVLVEKPVAVHKATAARPTQVFAAMFNQRTDPRYRRVHGPLQSGELGPVRRVAWTD